MIVQGETRIVFIIGNYAIKIPNFLKGYRQFLYGLISNTQEVHYQKQSHYLMPVIFRIPFNFVIVMPKAKVLSENLSFDDYVKITDSLGAYPKVDHKPDSFGIWKNQVYVIDYGTTI
jgi:hypothetical protein